MVRPPATERWPREDKESEDGTWWWKDELPAEMALRSPDPEFLAKWREALLNNAETVGHEVSQKIFVI